MSEDAPERAHEDLSAANMKLVRQHYHAFASGDLEGLAAGLDPNVTIVVSDERGKAVSEPIRGRDGAREFFGGIHAQIQHATVDIGRLRVDGDKVLAQVTLGGTARRSGRTGAIPAVHLFSIFDGLITEIRTHRPDWRHYADAEGARP
jgi:ketosteroid isomerase-like protein